MCYCMSLVNQLHKTLREGRGGKGRRGGGERRQQNLVDRINYNWLFLGTLSSPNHGFLSRQGHCREWVWGRGSLCVTGDPWAWWAGGSAGLDGDHRQAWTSPERKEGKDREGSIKNVAVGLQRNVDPTLQSSLPPLRRVSILWSSQANKKMLL